MATADRLYRRAVAFTRFFSRGWGPVETYEKLLDFRHVIFSREGCMQILSDHPQRVSTRKVKSIKEGVIYDGKFRSPLAAYLPGMLPRESEEARFEMVLPHGWRSTKKPMYIHLAGTGDHYFWRRRAWTALPTLRSANIGAVSLENPFYGSRKPREQTRSQVHHVSDLFVMGMALILECMVILHWLEEQGLGPVGLTGFSMGGHNCSLAAALWPKAVAVVPCLSWSTGSSVFTEGLLTGSVCWDVLEEQLFYSQIGADERRRECLRRMRELEIEALKRVTNTGLIETETSSTGDGGGSSRLVSTPWNIKEVYTSKTNEATAEKNIWNSVLQPSEGWEREMPGDSAMTASLQGMGVASYLFRRAVASFKQGAQEEVASVRNTWKSVRRKDGLPRPELLDAMRMVLDSFTNHWSFPVPLCPELAQFVTAKEDAYIPRGHIVDVRTLWPGCGVQYVNGGHISATVLQQTTVQQALKHTMEKASGLHHL